LVEFQRYLSFTVGAKPEGRSDYFGTYQKDNCKDSPKVRSFSVPSFAGVEQGMDIP